MKNKLLLLSLILTFSAAAQKSTRYWEVGGYFGSSNPLSDINVDGDFGTMMAEMKAKGGFLFRYNTGTIFSVGAEIGYGALYASDANHGSNNSRGFEMNTRYLHLGTFMNVNFRKFGKYHRSKSNTPFIKLGVGALAFNPELDESVNFDNIADYEFYPNAYQAFVYQLGFGWKWRLGYHFILSANIEYNGTNTDYLEGFTNTASSNNDGFYGMYLGFTYAIF